MKDKCDKVSEFSEEEFNEITKLAFNLIEWGWEEVPSAPSSTTRETKR